MSDQPVIFDENYISSMLEIDDPLFAIELYEIYLQQAKSILGKLGDPSCDNIDEILHLAHKIKSSSRSVGALTLGAHLEAIECAARENDLEAVFGAIHSMGAIATPTISMIENRLRTLRDLATGSG